MKNNLSKYFKIIFYNFLVFILLIFIIEIFFGNWFKNNFNLKMSSERNIKRLYKYNFDNHKGIVKYERDNFGFRTNKKIEPENIDIVFIGGSTVNQKFISYDKTIVSLLQNKFSSAKNKKTVVNAGVDGMSSIGHINSFPMWFDKISNFKPKYYIFYIGINDLKIFNDYKIEGTDLLEEGTLKKNIQEYIESNSFIYNELRKFNILLYLKYNIQIKVNKINKKTFVYGQRLSKSFINWIEAETTYNRLVHDKEPFNSFEKHKQNIRISEFNKFEERYLKILKKITLLTKERNAEPIFINQISGNGLNLVCCEYRGLSMRYRSFSPKLYFISKTIMRHCVENNLTCLNLAKDSDLKYDDFYDWAHLNPKGSIKVSNYIFNNLYKHLK